MTKVPSVAKKLLAVIIGGVAFVALIKWAAYIGYGFLVGNLQPIGLMGELINDGYSEESIYYLKDHDIYTTLGWILLCLSGALIATLSIWEDHLPSSRKLLIVFGLLAILIPLSLTNFVHGDAFSTRSLQALFNIPIVIFAGLAILELTSFRPKSRVSVVLLVAAIAIILMQGLIIPAVYSLLWWLNFQNAISLADSRNLAPNWITWAAIVASTAYLYFGIRSKWPSGRSQYSFAFVNYRSVQMGDVFSNISNSTIVNRSRVETAFNKYESISEHEVAEFIRQVSEIVAGSGSQEAGELLDQFNEEVGKDEPRVSLLKRSWNSLVELLPEVAKVAGASAALAKLFG